MFPNTGGLPITQIAVVVKDLRKTMEMYHKALGWGPWNVFEHKGEGLHHVACMLHTHAEADEARKRFERMGAQVLMGGRIGESIQFYYLDTEPLLKVIIESGSGHAIDLKP